MMTLPQTKTDIEIHFPFEFFIEGTPIASSNMGNSKKEWIELVKTSYKLLLPEDHWVSSDIVYVTILYFPDAPMQGDIDNIVKWIVDAMRKSIYIDDRQVERVIVQKFEPGRDASFADPTDTLSVALDMDRPIVYIRVDDEFSAKRIWQ